MAEKTEIQTWILVDNLYTFLERLSGFVGVHLEEWDWDAIRFGIRDLDEQTAPWYDYQLSGDPFLNLAFARSSDPGHLNIRAKAEPSIAAKLEALAIVLHISVEYADPLEIENLLQTAFPDRTYPGDNSIVSCDAAHLAQCEECQETLANFRGRHWSEVFNKGRLMHNWGGLYFMTPQARHFFFPAYVGGALRDRDTSLLEHAIKATPGQDPTLLQQEVFALISRLAEEEKLR
jgi:hypothetical protein